jgi:hypothetical protein
MAPGVLRLCGLEWPGIFQIGRVEAEAFAAFQCEP